MITWLQIVRISLLIHFQTVWNFAFGPVRSQVIINFEEKFGWIKNHIYHVTTSSKYKTGSKIIPPRIDLNIWVKNAKKISHQHHWWNVWILCSWIILAKTKSWNSGGQPDAHGGICAPHINTWNQNRIHSVENENNGGHPSSSILPSLISSKLYFNFDPI